MKRYNGNCQTKWKQSKLVNHPAAKAAPLRRRGILKAVLGLNMI
jgi:hypothetical protein